MTLLSRTRHAVALVAAAGAVLVGLSLAIAPTASADTALCSDTLRQGDSGGCVSQLQQRLNELGSNLAVDGSFGPATDHAVLAFQGRSSIGFDGIVGPQTQAYLASPSVDLYQTDTGTIGAYIDQVFGGDAATARRIANCESSMQETALNYNTNGTYDIGVFQVNEVHAGADLTGFRHDMLYYQSNIQKAHDIYLGAGGFGPWYSSQACWG